MSALSERRALISSINCHMYEAIFCSKMVASLPSSTNLRISLGRLVFVIALLKSRLTATSRSIRQQAAWLNVFNPQRTLGPLVCLAPRIQ